MLRTPDPGPQVGVSSCLGKCLKSSPDATRQPFSGKSFYLDLPAGKNLQFLTKAIQQLGGVIEGFLSKEVSYVVSSRREAKTESGVASHRGCPSSSEVRLGASSPAHQKGSHARPSQTPAGSVPMSRGKELLQKAIRKQGSSRGGSGSGSHSSLLTSARSWGVQVLHVDEMMLHVQQLSLGFSSMKKQATKQPEGTRPGMESRARKVARLKAPFLKVEDGSRKFRPLHHQFKSFPEIYFLGPKDASPFEALMTPGSIRQSRGRKDREPSLGSAVRTMPRRKKGYCECCQKAFEELREHLQSAQHQSFAQDAHPYAEIDRIIEQLSHTFVDISQATLPRQSGSPASECYPLCPETLSSSQPSHPRVASPRMQKEDDCQAPGSPEEDGTVDGMKAPAEPAGTGKVPGPEESCQQLGAAVVSVDPPGTSVSRSLTCQCLLASSGFKDLSSGLNLALVGHKRKLPFSSDNAEKRPGVSWPQASFFVPRARSPCSTRTAGGRHHLSLPLLGHESRPLSSLLPLHCPLACLSLPDRLPQQPTDRPAEFWATQPPWSGRRWHSESEGLRCTAPARVSQQADQLPSCPTAGQLPAHQHSAAGGPAESQATLLPHSGAACVGASCSQWFWTPQPLPGSCLPVPQIQALPSAGRELLL